MKHLLIVSPHFPPVNAPDHQRVRTMLAHLGALGWRATVLAVAPADVEGAPLDPLFEHTYPAEVPIHRVRALPTKWTRPLGFGTLGLRCLPAIARAGSKLLQEESIDAVLFSTAQFSVMSLGPRWRKRFGVPYLLDFQDPWLAEPTAAHRKALPGGWKYRFSQWQAGLLEPRSVRGSAHCVCVSQAYPPMLRRRYPELPETHFSVIPFGAARVDLAVAEKEAGQAVFDPTDGRRHLVCTGIVEEPFRPALTALLRAVAAWRQTAGPQRAAQIALHFVGTSYAPRPTGVSLVTEVSQALGLQEVVFEHRPRIPYFSALRCWLDAQALLLLGSDDPGYVPSKLQPMLLSGRPILGSLSLACAAWESALRAGVWLTSWEAPDHDASIARFLDGLVQQDSLPLPQSSAIRTSVEMTAEIVQILDRVTSRSRTQP